ncbi:protein CEBPZOS-like [Genypterus blacodes]|uniref:protein CEBPZOS-like n=1 Tax=Genypterus blacodes TaxID=154954 RepID=UPI003F763BFF
MAGRLVGGLLVLELLGLMGAYGLFHRMNTSTDLRNSMKSKFPSLLEVYYKSNEWAGIHGIRERDRENWAAKRQ